MFISFTLDAKRFFSLLFFQVFEVGASGNKINTMLQLAYFAGANAKHDCKCMLCFTIFYFLDQGCLLL